MHLGTLRRCNRSEYLRLLSTRPITRGLASECGHISHHPVACCPAHWDGQNCRACGISRYLSMHPSIWYWLGMGTTRLAHSPLVHRPPPLTPRNIQRWKHLRKHLCQQTVSSSSKRPEPYPTEAIFKYPCLGRICSWRCGSGTSPVFCTTHPYSVARIR